MRHRLGMVPWAVLHVAGAAAAMPPQTLVWRGSSLAARRVDDSGTTLHAIAQLLQSADVELAKAPVTVTDKTVAPPSGDVHDYWSVASYFWPCNVTCNSSMWADCSRWCMPPEILHDGHKCTVAPAKDNITCDKTTGLPWAGHDGYPRAEDTSGRYLQGDRPRADGITKGTATLALSWYFTSAGSIAANATAAAVYLQHACLLLRVFFLDKKTAMNPNMNFAQGIPGRLQGSPYGSVDFARFWMVLDSVRVIESDPTTLSEWTATDRRQFRDWVSRFLDWWMHSANGKLCRARFNNIGTAYENLEQFATAMKQVGNHVEGMS